jgi:hypothetical protein
MAAERNSTVDENLVSFHTVLKYWIMKNLRKSNFNIIL